MAKTYGPRDPDPCFTWDNVSIFLAGSISGCEDWQSRMVNLLVNRLPDNVYLVNPRNPGVMDPKDASTAVPQIEWEYEELKDAATVSFWFDEGSLAPITLFELGKELVKAQARGNNAKHLFIGIHPNYPRRLDVETQVRLMFPDFEFSYSVEELANYIAIQFEKEEN